MNQSSEDPAAILDEHNQWTEPWGASEDGSRCEKCHQTGVAKHRCWSCLLTEPTPDCPACGGRVQWSDTCPVCRGRGVVDGTRRRGVSVYPKLEGLYHYMLANDAELKRCLVVELDGERSADVDFDADEGALLVQPTAIRGCAQTDREMIDAVRERARQIDA